MKQETGKTNLRVGNNEVSIQLKLGGLSFSAFKTSIPEDISSIKIVIDTPRVTLAPREAVSLDNATEILRLAGKPCRMNEQSVCSELQADIVAIMAIDYNALSSIVEEWYGRISFHSPLLDMRHSNESCLTIDATDEVCYMRLFDNGLQRAEAFEATTPEDTLYLAKKWLGDNEMPIYIKSSKAIAKLLRKYFKRVICES